MGPRVPFAPALLTSSLLITLHIYFISSLLFILLYVIRVMVNKAVKKNFFTQIKTSPQQPSPCSGQFILCQGGHSGDV